MTGPAAGFRVATLPGFCGAFASDCRKAEDAWGAGVCAGLPGSASWTLPTYIEPSPSMIRSSAPFCSTLKEFKTESAATALSPDAVAPEAGPVLAKLCVLYGGGARGEERGTAG